MNRRGFFGTIGKAAAGFMILPGAGRVWKAVVDARVINPDWVSAPYSIEWVREPELDEGLYQAWTLVEEQGKQLVKLRYRFGGSITGVFDGVVPYDPVKLANEKPVWDEILYANTSPIHTPPR